MIGLRKLIVSLVFARRTTKDAMYMFHKRYMNMQQQHEAIKK